MELRSSARRQVLRAGATAVGVTAVLLVLPGTAAAAGVTPVLDCIRTQTDGSWTAVLGYANDGPRAVELRPGSKDNRIRPERLAPALPGRFEPGVHRGAVSVTVDRGDGFEWQLDRQVLRVDAASGPACPPSTEMPADGNGTGIVVALGVAGVAGAALVGRARRRAAVPAAPGVHDA